MQNIVIISFSGIYEKEQFYKGEPISWIDLKELSGTNCYCDEVAKAQILEKTEKYPTSGIYFIDSGNYHYMSRIGAEEVEEPFNLLVFDNHTDMQLPAFGGILSCGGWIASALEEVENLREVWLIGPDEEAYQQVEEPFKSRVHFLSREKLADLDMQSVRTQEFLNAWISELPADLPLYVSIDKDVLGPEEAATTWSQGDMTLKEMLEILERLRKHFSEKGGRFVRVDICGECDPDESVENYKNDHANKELLKFWKRSGGLEEYEK